jgi:hypothetical protein
MLLLLPASPATGRPFLVRAVVLVVVGLPGVLLSISIPILIDALSGR